MCGLSEYLQQSQEWRRWRGGGHKEKVRPELGPEGKVIGTFSMARGI